MVTRWHTLYRADGLQRCSPADVETLRALGLHTVIDLRTDRSSKSGRFPVDAYPVDFHHLPVIDVTWDVESVGDHDRRPTSCSTSTGRCWPTASRCSPRPSTSSACRRRFPPSSTARRARTGPHPRRADPGLARCPPRAGQRGLRPVPGRPRADSGVGARPQPRDGRGWDAVPANHMAAEPEAIARLLAALAEEHGSIRDYVVSIGVPNAAAPPGVGAPHHRSLSGAGPRAGHSVASRRAASPPAGAAGDLSGADRAGHDPGRSGLAALAPPPAGPAGPRARARARRRRGANLEHYRTSEVSSVVVVGAEGPSRTASRSGGGGLPGFELVDQRALARWTAASTRWSRPSRSAPVTISWRTSGRSRTG